MFVRAMQYVTRSRRICRGDNPEGNFRCSDFRMAVCPAAYISLVACCMAVGDFSTSLRSARNDRDERDLRKEI